MFKMIWKMLLNQRGEVALNGEPQLDENGNEIPSPGAKQEPEEDQLKKLQEQIAALEKEKSGIYRDLKGEQEKRRQYEDKLLQLEQKVTKAEDEDFVSQVGDEDFITGKQLKAFIDTLSKRERERYVRDAQMRGQERAATDEVRMKEIVEANPKKYPVNYDEAIQAFIELADKDPGLWRQYDTLKFTPGGKPAEFAYKYALREHDKYRAEAERKTRENLIEELRRKENEPVRLRSGSGAGKRIEDLSDVEISNMSDDELEKAMRG